MSRSSSDSTATEAFPDVPDIQIASPSPSPSPQPPFGLTSITATASAPTVVPPPNPNRARVHYAMNVDTAAIPQSAPHLPSLSPSPGIRRRNTRSNTFVTIDDYEDYERRPGWQPGAEPGLDPSKPDGGQDSMPKLHAECQITVVDFSQNDLKVQELDNAGLIDFVKAPQPSWVKCRWINVNGLSWDVIQALGNYKNLHRLAIEDIMNTRNRTKADWYANHAFLILTCQKLVRMMDDNDSSSDSDDEDDGFSVKSHRSVQSAVKKVNRWITGKKRQHPTAAGVLESGRRRKNPPSTSSTSFTHQPTGFSDVFNPNTICTLQRYHAAPNTARTEYMEKHSALASRGLAVMAEQVAMFITSDNTVIAFFEQSADDVERPILARLQSPTTILRQSCDASMVAQAIIDAIIDMAIPVTACYADVVGDLEIDVLTHPNISHTKNLYIIISEINKLFSFVNPIQTLISALRDHKTKLSTHEEVTRELQNPLMGVIITPMAYTYLGDVYDHCVLITENLNQIKESANHMIDLIFNTIATYQNESMKQLTIATIIFLPLTFLTGYFGQNFTGFGAIDGSVIYFWKIAIPLAVFTIAVLMREVMYDSFVRFFQRRHIVGVRKKRNKRMKRSQRDRRPRSS
ncbi:Uu.00g079550.m01.CDS01 [Anthostomella pinea]|uniref:Uu.00g079550.m01.CDS01 n=1 Tax=Anthostomella pinea TaxID=933095 RepID=A0AAI8VKU4_9PEZI|nr:Uu.00g079550.m01.CDS01 [Anthostomella pinea]